MRQPDFSSYRFHPVIHLPSDYEVYDFTHGYEPKRILKSPFGIGRYDEKRAGMYTSEIFKGMGADRPPRDIHMGIDIAAPVGTPVHAFFAGVVHLVGYNGADGDYGCTLITRHRLGDIDLYALHGHLDRRSIETSTSGRAFAAGDVIAWIGDRHENGGWNPHLHFQLSLIRPDVCDLPGVVSDQERDWARSVFPDPRWVLGNLYET